MDHRPVLPLALAVLVLLTSIGVLAAPGVSAHGRRPQRPVFRDPFTPEGEAALDGWGDIAALGIPQLPTFLSLGVEPGGTFRPSPCTQPRVFAVVAGSLSISLRGGSARMQRRAGHGSFLLAPRALDGPPIILLPGDSLLAGAGATLTLHNLRPGAAVVHTWVMGNG